MKLSATILAFCILAISAKAQQDIYYTVDTLKNKPRNMLITAGGNLDLAFQSKIMSSIGVYVHGRYTIGRFASVSATGIFAGQVTQPFGDYTFDTKYAYYEAKAWIHFKDRSEYVNTKFEFGTDGQYNYSATFPTQSRAIYAFSGGLYNHTYTVTRTGADSLLFSVTDDNNNLYKGDTIYTNVSTTVLAAGISMSIATNYKFRFNLSTNQKKYYKGSKTGDVSLEFLYGFANVYDKKVGVTMPNGQVLNYNIDKLQKKRMGFRIQAEGRSGVLSYRTEFGARPGAKYLGAANKKWASGLYMCIGIGFGF